MLSDAGTIECLISGKFGTDTLTYLQNKHRGGVNGGKGTRYEDIFAIIQVAEYAQRLGVDCGLVSLEAQAPLYFVDDLIVCEQGKGDTFVESCFQLKNSPHVTWGSGEKSIADDCKKQLELSAAKGFTLHRVILVTSDKQCAESLANTIPADLSNTKRVEVRWLPWAESTNILCKNWPDQMSSIAWLSKHESPNFQEIAEVLAVLLGVWVSQGEKVTVFELIEEARKLSPTLIRPLVSDETALSTLTEAFKNVLAQVQGFSYSVVKGFFCWKISYPNGSIQSGVFAQDCLTDSFRKFQERVVRQQQPVTFEDMEEELL